MGNLIFALIVYYLNYLKQSYLQKSATNELKMKKKKDKQKEREKNYSR